TSSGADDAAKSVGSIAAASPAPCASATSTRRATNESNGSTRLSAASGAAISTRGAMSIAREIRVGGAGSSSSSATGGTAATSAATASSSSIAATTLSATSATETTSS